MICKEYIFNKIKIWITFTGEYFIDRDDGLLHHSSPKHSMMRFEQYVYYSE